MTVSELLSVLSITRRSDKRKLARLCQETTDQRKVPVLFHIDNIYVDSIFRLDRVNAATIDGIKREFITWVEGLERQIKAKTLRLCGLEIKVVENPRFAYFEYTGTATVPSLVAYEPNMNTFERILVQYLQQHAEVIFNRWFVLAVRNGKVVVYNDPLGIYRVTDLLRPVAAAQGAAKAVRPGAATPKGHFATKIFSSMFKIGRQPRAPDRASNLQAAASLPKTEIPRPTGKVDPSLAAALAPKAAVVAVDKDGVAPPLGRFSTAGAADSALKTAAPAVRQPVASTKEPAFGASAPSAGPTPAAAPAVLTPAGKPVGVASGVKFEAPAASKLPPQPVPAPAKPAATGPLIVPSTRIIGPAVPLQPAAGPAKATPVSKPRKATGTVRSASPVSASQIKERSRTAIIGPGASGKR